MLRAVVLNCIPVLWPKDSANQFLAAWSVNGMHGTPWRGGDSVRSKTGRNCGFASHTLP